MFKMCVLDNNKILDQQCHLVQLTGHRLEKLVTQLTDSKTDHEALEGCMCSKSIESKLLRSQNLMLNLLHPKKCKIRRWTPTDETN